MKNEQDRIQFPHPPAFMGEQQGRSGDDLQVEGAWMGFLIAAGVFLAAGLIAASWLGWTE